MLGHLENRRISRRQVRKVRGAVGQFKFDVGSVWQAGARNGRVRKFRYRLDNASFALPRAKKKTAWRGGLSEIHSGLLIRRLRNDGKTSVTRD